MLRSNFTLSDIELIQTPDTAIVVVEASPLAVAAPIADRAAAAHVFADYQRRKSPQTLRRQRAALLLLTTAAGIVCRACSEWRVCKSWRVVVVLTTLASLVGEEGAEYTHARARRSSTSGG